MIVRTARRLAVGLATPVLDVGGDLAPLAFDGAAALVVVLGHRRIRQVTS